MGEEPTPFEALRVAVEKAGSQAKLATICGVSQTAVWKWLQSSKRVPAEYVLRIEAETGISRKHLRPDIYPVSITAEDVVFPLGRPSEDLPAPTAPVACDPQPEAQAKDAA